MDSELEDIIDRMQITKLESKLALREIERDSLNREIASRILAPGRRVEALDRWDQLQSECTALMAELQIVRRSQPHG